MDKVPENILNKKLYLKVKEEAKQKYKRFPSAYASAWINKQYQKEGGKYKDDKKNNSTGVNRWMKEEWIQILPYVENGKKIPCGGQNKDTKACRPLIRVNKQTPITMDEIVKKWGKEKVIDLAKQKNKDMQGRLNWMKGTFKPS